MAGGRVLVCSRLTRDPRDHIDLGCLLTCDDHPQSHWGAEEPQGPAQQCWGQAGQARARQAQPTERGATGREGEPAALRLSRQMQKGDGFYLCQSKLGRAGIQGPWHQGTRCHKEVKAKNGVLCTTPAWLHRTRNNPDKLMTSTSSAQLPHSPTPGSQDTVPQVQVLPKHHKKPVRFCQCHQPPPTHCFWDTTVQLSIPS